MTPNNKETILKWRDNLCALLRIGTLATAAFTWLGLLSGAGWIFDLVSHFRWQYALIQLCFCAPAIWWFWQRQEAELTPSLSTWVYHRSELSVLVASLLLNCLLIGQLYLPAENSKGQKEAASFKVIQLNVNSRNDRYEDVTALIRQYDPDVIALQEVSEEWCRALKTRLNKYPHCICQARMDNFGVALFSKRPLTKGEIVLYGTAGVPTVLAELEFDGAPLSVLSTHPLPPMAPEYFDFRNDQFSALAKARAGWRKSVVLLGDLNCTSWSQYFSDFCRSAGVKDSRQGFGIQSSWPTQVFLLTIPIDHCLISADLIVKDRKICQSVGSDHYPVYMELVRKH